MATAAIIQVLFQCAVPLVEMEGEQVLRFETTEIFGMARADCLHAGELLMDGIEVEALLRLRMFELNSATMDTLLSVNSEKMAT